MEQPAVNFEQRVLRLDETIFYATQRFSDFNEIKRFSMSKAFLHNTNEMTARKIKWPNYTIRDQTAIGEKNNHNIYDFLI